LLKRGENFVSYFQKTANNTTGWHAKAANFSAKDKEYVAARQQSAKFLKPTTTITSEGNHEKRARKEW